MRPLGQFKRYIMYLWKKLIMPNIEWCFEARNIGGFYLKAETRAVIRTGHKAKGKQQSPPKFRKQTDQSFLNVQLKKEKEKCHQETLMRTFTVK